MDNLHPTPLLELYPRVRDHHTHRLAWLFIDLTLDHCLLNLPLGYESVPRVAHKLALSVALCPPSTTTSADQCMSNMHLASLSSHSSDSLSLLGR